VLLLLLLLQAADKQRNAANQKYFHQTSLRYDLQAYLSCNVVQNVYLGVGKISANIGYFYTPYLV